ncbi:glutamate racemase [Rhodospirillaceae bacterium KN72]|uniref:Glutamate racemase n=1 Tax=Pacificispira spongiicola TaxID=2729598 RepID=A0A7Y0DYU7_9PROT|nr:glutamate racemase [Pacificispira spongiicola]NMM44134.1 glutamate racemase [Pacificispira spongiicola]
MIGVFDSGHGGLTVLRALVDALPQQRFLYLGDHGFAPYGMRSNEEIYQLTRRRVGELISRGCRLVIIACNTACAVALRRLQQEWLPKHAPDCRVLGVFVPMIEALTGQEWHVQGVSAYSPKRPPQTIAVFATRRTVESGAFPAEVKLRARHLKVIQQSCPRLAEAVEEGLDDDLMRRAVARYCDQLLAKAGSAKIDIVVLGCTHYPILEAHFRAALPPDTRLMSQPDIVAKALVQYLGRHPEFRDTGTEHSTVEFLTSGDPQKVREVSSRFFGADLDFRHLSGWAEPKPEPVPVVPPKADETTEGEETSHDA